MQNSNYSYRKLFNYNIILKYVPYVLPIYNSVIINNSSK